MDPSKVSDADAAIFCFAFSKEKYSIDQILFQEGEIADKIFLIKNGEIELEAFDIQKNKIKVTFLIFSEYLRIS